MTTWHDIADQLTPTQVGHLLWLEGDPMGGVLARPEQHLMLARGWSSYNLAQSFHADVPPPVDSADVGPWIKPAGGERCRAYRCLARVGDLDIWIETSGSQYTDGRIEAQVSLTGDLTNLPPAGVREVAAALLATADRIEPR